MDELRCKHGFYGDGCEKCQELKPLSSDAVLADVMAQIDKIKYTDTYKGKVVVEVFKLQDVLRHYFG